MNPLGAASPRNVSSTEAFVTAQRRKGGHRTLWQKVLDATTVPLDIPGAPGEKTLNFKEGAQATPAQSGKPKSLRLAAQSSTPKALSSKDTAVLVNAIPESTTEKSPRFQDAVPSAATQPGKLRTSALAAPVSLPNPVSTKGGASGLADTSGAHGKKVPGALAPDGKPSASAEHQIVDTSSPPPPVDIPDSSRQIIKKVRSI
ncbi:uncharacterized protein LOC144102358 [Amblyomma americanum]